MVAATNRFKPEAGCAANLGAIMRFGSAAQDRRFSRPRVVIVGAGFGGLSVARALTKPPVARGRERVPVGRM